MPMVGGSAKSLFGVLSTIIHCAYQWACMDPESFV